MCYTCFMRHKSKYAESQEEGIRMAICSHCGRQSQANALNCEFCGFPLATQEDDMDDDLSGRDTVYTSSPSDGAQDDAQATVVEQENGGALAKVVVRPLQDAGEASREFALTGQNISIGRSPSCEIVLENDQLTSRRHALLRYDGAHYTIVDLGSSNGTFVNDTEIRDATPLSHGDRVIVGEHELLFSTNVAGAAPIAGVDLNGAPPSSPLASTGEQPAVRPDQQDTPQETPAAEASDGSNADANGADEAYMATVMTEVEPAPAAEADVSGAADVSDVSDVADVSDASDVADVADVSDISDISDTAKSPRVSVEQGSVEPANGSMPESTPLLARAPSSGSLSQPGGELDQLRAQLAQLAATSEVVAQHAADETNLSEQRRQALAETRDQLHAILAGIQNASNQTGAEPEDTGDLTDLIAVSQQAAADPNHLQNVSRLAEHASDISKALEALQAHRLQPPRPSAEENALAELRALQARLDELA